MGAGALIRATATSTPSRVPISSATQAIWSVSETPLAISCQLATMTSGCIRAAGAPRSVGELERQRLGLEPAAEHVLATAAGRHARGKIVVQEVVDPVRPQLVAEAYDHTARLARQRGEDHQVGIVRRGQRQRGEIVEDDISLS